MPKPHSCPALYDEMKTVSISFLSKHGYLQPNQCSNGTINWNRNGERIASISIGVSTRPERSHVELDYKCNGIPIKYRVILFSKPSNLGKGVVWYFICPSTGKACRKLYLAHTYFYHRSAFIGCMYQKQTHSKKGRQLEKLFAYLGNEQLYEQLHKKHFKKMYAGKPTKKYLRITQQLDKAERISPHELERLLLS